MNATRDALTRLRAAMLDLIAAGRHTEANDVLAIIERIDPPMPVMGEAAGSAAGRVLGPGNSDPSPLFPPAAAGSGTFRTLADHNELCANCERPLPQHCTTHLLACCPGSLMHGQDEGTWTPSAPSL